MTNRQYLLWLGLIVLAALGLPLGIFGAGLYRLISDESAHILTTWHLSGTNALEPFRWPPFYKLFVGTTLKVYPNIFMTPRILVCAMGLLSLLSVTWLTNALFKHRRINLSLPCWRHIGCYSVSFRPQTPTVFFSSSRRQR